MVPIREKLGMIQYTTGPPPHAEFGPDLGKMVGRELKNLQICKYHGFRRFLAFSPPLGNVIGYTD